MLYTNATGRKFNIPDDYLSKQMQKLGVSKMEAVQLWLEDNGVEVNAEQEELDKKAKDIKIQHGANNADKVRKSSATRERKPNLEKQNIVAALASTLANDNFVEGVNIRDIKIVKPEREISFQVNENTYSLTLTCHRKK